MRIFIPLDRERKYFILAQLPEPSNAHGDEYYFKVGKWRIRFERTTNTFEIQGVKNLIRLLRLRA